MHKPFPPLNALRAFEAAARHLSLTKAAEELSVTPGAISHQIRGLEAFLDVKLFERKVRAIALTSTGKLLYPGLQTGFGHIHEALAELAKAEATPILVISTPPGFTAKWLAPRLYKFSLAAPDIDARVSSSISNADFVTDGVDVAIRNLPADHGAGPDLTVEPLVDIRFLTVCSPKLLERFSLTDSQDALFDVPLIHDETFTSRANMPGWADWLKAANISHGDPTRGLRFNSADHALDAAVEGAGLLLTHGVLAYDDLRTGRLVQPFPLTLESGRAYYLVSPKAPEPAPAVTAFATWVREEARQLDPQFLGTVNQSPE